MKNYSDYVGVNLWTHEIDPINDADRQVYLDWWEKLKSASQYLQKPICLCELPCRYKDVFKTITDEAMVGDNICQVYDLFALKPKSSPTHLFEVDEDTYRIVEVEPCYSNFIDVLTWAELEGFPCRMFILIGIGALIVVFIGLGIKRLS